MDTLDINRSYETKHAVIGDAKLTLQALIAELSKVGRPKKNGAVLDEISAARKKTFQDEVPARSWNRTTSR